MANRPTSPRVSAFSTALLAALSVAFLVAFLAVLLAPAATAQVTAQVTAEEQALYRSVAVVTGTGEKNSGPGFVQCLRDVLVKTTGDPSILNDRRLPGSPSSARDLIQTFSYRDVLEGKPPHDEQGTYDRPHFLTVAFDPAKIDALVRALGRQTWRPPRPRLMAFVAVESMHATFMLSRDGAQDRSADMRSALAAASEKLGLSVQLPDLSELEARGWSAKTLPDVAADDLAQVAQGDVPLAGRMVFREAALGWIVEWRLKAHGKIVTWRARGINFDGAFRNAVSGAAQILSGHGQPR